MASNKYGAFKLYGIPVMPPKLTTGSIWFVCNATDTFTNQAGLDSNSGRDPEHPLATLNAAIGKCTADKGDIIYVMPGHAEAPTAEITADVANISIIGLGDGKNRAKITANHTGDVLAIDADDVTIDNIYFAASSAAAAAQIDIAAAQAVIKNCYIEQSANNLAGITIAAAGIGAKILGNEFHVTANGPDHAIKVESASASDLHVIDNYFNGGSTTNGWDTGGVLSGVANKDVVIKDNVFMHGASNIGHIQFTTSTVTGVIANNLLGGGTLGQMLDPGGCMCFLNYEADAVDQTGRVFPTTAAS